MYKQLLHDAAYKAELNRQFIHAVPFPYIIIDNFLHPEIARTLADNFPSLSEMNVQYNGLNEKKGEHSRFDTLHSVFIDIKRELMKEGFVKIIETISGIQKLQTIDDRYGCGLHQGGAGSFLDIHIDYNLHPTLKKQRRLNLILFLNEQWQEEWFGYLEFWDAAGKKCVRSIAPVFNRCVLFICNNISYHGYSTIKCPPDVYRKSFYLYFFSEPEKSMLFHDTVFTPSPDDSFWRKQIIRGKEWIKNSVKRIFYYSGLNKWLK
ncbi:MAG: 2OG-Fe(II) oxygenase [Bacteroidota bacterium]|nr:2OG-Fe(II) oxygenase [Bacteroidota bacterium]